MGSRKADNDPKQAPFFSRYLEGQEGLDPDRSAKLAGQKQLAYKQSATPPLQTRKFPSDSDELDFCPHYRNEADVPDEYRGGGLVTLKFPSDNDEEFWQAEYIEQADVPRSQRVKPKPANVKLKKSRRK
ncbi:MAG TPA: microviridin/marinostatin family tricyclic proteinase inhibitor [Blastocatellia bacterium]|nr:microviridin/marinostatin family tricyclic proteinase inhibitor [Blastocatellia bacterium]